MSGFIYNNQSTETIIGRKLMLVSYNGAVDTVTGVNRQNQTGEATISRPIANEYGTINENLTFSYTLIVDPCEQDSGLEITRDEQVIIERWLTSPKFSRDLQVINGNYEVMATYYGKFTSTEWIPENDGFSGVTFTFENNGAYAKQHYTYNSSSTASGGWQMSVFCNTDELEEYTYPTLTITNTNATTPIRITNQSDTGAINQVTMNVQKNVPIKMDCFHCLVTNGNTGGTFSFADLGWTDVGNIYWPRLIPGSNTLIFNKPCSVKVEFDVVRKKVGGWLYD